MIFGNNFNKNNNNNFRKMLEETIFFQEFGKYGKIGKY